VLLSGSPAGHIALWNLEERKLAGQMRNAHSSGVCGLRALPGEALLVTSSADNTVKMWVFDMADGGGRLLRYREGEQKILIFISK
jgi:U3 small nucleolar RNA-associated protein 21